MVSLHLPRPLVWGMLVVLGLAVLMPARQLPAQDGCVAVDANDLPRDCTFLEEHGECLWNALDSFGTCMEDAESFLGEAACYLAVEIDIFACNVALPLEIFRSVAN